MKHPLLQNEIAAERQLRARVAKAEKLAEALRDLIDLTETVNALRPTTEVAVARAALAEWDAQ